VFACANPTPEIFLDEAKAGGAKVIATGRSDFPNQNQQVLAFPGVFRGAFDVRASDNQRPDEAGRRLRLGQPHQRQRSVPGLHHPRAV
jgi:hypothetical protein